MAKIFVSYRRKDSGSSVDALMLHLKRAFGKNNVFHDVGTIKPGELFPEVIRRRMIESDAVVAVVGPNYLDAGNACRLLEADDPVRLELEMALALGIPLVPVTVEGALMPVKDQIPPTLTKLAETQAHEVRQGKSFEHDLNELVSELKRVTWPSKRKRLVAVGAVIGSLLLSALIGLLVGRSNFSPARPPHDVTVHSEYSIDSDGNKQHRLWIDAAPEVIATIDHVKYLFDTDDEEWVYPKIMDGVDPTPDDSRHFLIHYPTRSGHLSYITVVVAYNNYRTNGNLRAIGYQWLELAKKVDE